MPIKPLSSRQAKLMRLALDSGAADGEALNALCMLRNSLQAEGPDPHELVGALRMPDSPCQKKCLCRR